MNKRILSFFMATLMVLTGLFGCTNNNAQASKEISSETPYYYVTNGTIIKERNHYMEVEVKMPEIKYYNEETDPLFDPINKEIKDTITRVTDESKKNAYETYMAYLESAKSNVENEKAKMIEALKNKYKSILTDDEVKAIRELENEEVFRIATESFIHVDGFTNSQDILNEGPHNKRIIIVNPENVSETTIGASSNELKQATVKIEGKPGNNQTFIPQEFGNIGAITETKSTTKNTESAKSKNTKKNKAVKDEKKSDKVVDEEKKPASPSEIDLNTEEITIENFYKELKRIKRLHVPNNMSLTMSYIPTYIYCDFDVKCLDEDYISLYIYFYETRNQTSSKVLFYNIDLKNKKLLNIKDVLGDDYKDICLKSINNSIENLSEDKKSLLTSKYNIEDFINDDTTFFINNNHMPVIVFDKYVIAAGAAGYPEFQIVK